MNNPKFFCLIISLITISTSLVADDNLNFKDCSDVEVQLIKEHVIEARLGAQKILEQINERSEEIKSYSRSIKRQVKASQNILNCSIEELESPRYSCNKIKNDKVYNAGLTLPLRGARVKLTSIREGGLVSLGQTLLHEATHHCKTTDAAYFGDTHNKKDPPKKVGIIGWSRIADTYSYWMRYGFCIPDIDC